MSANVVGGGTKGGQEGFDPLKLRDHFLESIKSLKFLTEETDEQIVKLEKTCQKQEQHHKKNAENVEKQYKVSSEIKQDLKQFSSLLPKCCGKKTGFCSIE